MKSLLKNGREQKGLKTREVAQILQIDQALISKFESGLRKPTKEQVLKLAELLEIDYETLMVTWLKEKILHEIGDDDFALKALSAAEKEIKYLKSVSKIKISSDLDLILKEIDLIQSKLSFSNSNIIENLDLEYTFESNRMEGNSMTLEETSMVINEGLTISGKSMREHLEVINHQEAIGFIKDLQKNNSFNERDLLSIHNILSRGINPEITGNYRKIIIENKETSKPISIAKDLEEYFIWYEINKNKLHPIILACEMKLRLLKIYPFAAENEKTSRLVLNLILMQKGYSIVNIKSDNENKAFYSQLVETANKGEKENLMLYIAKIEKESLNDYWNSQKQ